jgi:microcystin-dependent protein
MSDAFVGEIALFAFNKVPENWLPCDGRSLNIQQYAALSSLLGTYYGGDGRTTFNLPDLRGRTIVGFGSIPDSNYRVIAGQPYLPLGTAGAGGAETVTLTLAQMTMHNHELSYTTVNPPASSSIANAMLSIAQRGGGTPTTAPNPPGVYAAPTATLVPINAASVSATGGGAAHENRQPYLAVQACICTVGYYPPRQ